MKLFSTFLLILLFLNINAQSKEDLLSCLKIIFEQNEFQPAFNTDFTTEGCAYIEIPEFRFKDNIGDSLIEILSELRQVDFLNFIQRVRILNKKEVEFSEIPEHAILKIGSSGDSSTINFNIYTTITNERKVYKWQYVLVKNETAWQVEKSNLIKTDTKIPIRG